MFLWNPYLQATWYLKWMYQKLIFRKIVLEHLTIHFRGKVSFPTIHESLKNADG